jgi:hypothetical protein
MVVVWWLYGGTKGVVGQDALLPSAAVESWKGFCEDGWVQLAVIVTAVDVGPAVGQDESLQCAAGLPGDTCGAS